MGSRRASACGQAAQWMRVASSGSCQANGDTGPTRAAKRSRAGRIGRGCAAAGRHAATARLHRTRASARDTPAGSPAPMRASDAPAPRRADRDRRRSSIDRFVDREQASLMCQELAYGDLLLSLLRELRPVRADALFVVEPSARVGDRERHCGKPFGGGMNDHHRVLLPRITGLLVSNAAPEIDGYLAMV